MGRARARASQIYCVRRGFFLVSLLYYFSAKKKVQRPRSVFFEILSLVLFLNIFLYIILAQEKLNPHQTFSYL